MGYRLEPKIQGYEPIKGLEGPYRFNNGQILYYDPKEGAYWDPKTDFYLDRRSTLELWFGGGTV